MSVDVREWLPLLKREYLDAFIREGGAGVKFAVVPDDETAVLVKGEVRSMATDLGYLVADVDAAVVKVHLIQQVFHEVARQIPWEELAWRVIQRCYEELGYRVEQPQKIEAVAAQHQTDHRCLSRDLRKEIQSLLSRTHEMTRDFRYAMVWLCVEQASHDRSTDAGPILEWLKGDLRLISALKRLFIFQKIGRHNARAMLASLSAWCKLAGKTGLVLLWDLRQLAVAKRVDAGLGHHYTVAAAMDAYEVLRQMIDATDDLTGMFSLVVAPPELLDDERRGVRVYKALYERIWPDVRLRHQENPLSALANLGHSVGAGV